MPSTRITADHLPVHPIRHGVLALAAQMIAMIDWAEGLLPYDHLDPFDGGKLLALKPDGTTERISADGECWTAFNDSKIEYQSYRKKEASGSFDARLFFRTSTLHTRPNPDDPNRPIYTMLWVGGSPKPHQGHNLFGTDDPRVLIALHGKAALKSVGIELDHFTERNWREGRGVRFTRLDITRMLDFGSDFMCHEWLQAAEQFTNMKHRGPGKADRGTFYFGKHSRRWSLKIYHKATEMKCRRKDQKSLFPPESEEHKALAEYASGALRFELVIRSMELKRLYMDRGENWRTLQASDIWGEFMKSFEFPTEKQFIGIDVSIIPSKYQSTYLLWINGTPLYPGCPHMCRSKFYLHRAELKKLGINISMPPPTPERKVIPILRYIDAGVKTVPTWISRFPALLAA